MGQNSGLSFLIELNMETIRRAGGPDPITAVNETPDSGPHRSKGPKSGLSFLIGTYMETIRVTRTVWVTCLRL